ncbi:uncharacterized protein LOC128393965 isoform X2 [Panonychus citri]|uniref:uncharacterized protein LOC128393965 isoform X2 n=1 Tax=Panonychus citri TaxID=50023 RepID=UPI0023078B69|nr:uncharacterized protein LOC128393965 isoform X2 [Panonychus citri]
MAKHLPDNCLMIIFNYSNQLEDLINWAKVCTRWKDLILYRLSQVKYLLFSSFNIPISVDSMRLYYSGSLVSPGQGYLTELLPNLRILELGPLCLSSYKDLFKLLDHESIKVAFGSPVNFAADTCPANRGVASLAFQKRLISSCVALKQLYIKNNFPSFYINSDLELLLRLNLDSVALAYLSMEPTPLQLPRLKILELDFSRAMPRDHSGYTFMDQCSSLESAFIKSATKTCSVNETKINLHLHDLVIQNSAEYTHDWNCIRGILCKFPNLRHLAIRENDEIADINIEELVDMLPAIKLIDFRGSKGITKQSADFLNEYCSQSGRSSITIYYNCKDDEPSDWPKIIKTHDKVCYGFDFMKHCFFRYFDNLPIILDPKENPDL